MRTAEFSSILLMYRQGVGDVHLTQSVIVSPELQGIQCSNHLS